MISIAIPTYEMIPYGSEFLDYSLNKIYNQTYKNIEVVISDHSVDDIIKKTCDKWCNKLNIKYIRNNDNRGSSSANINNAMKYCTGEYIKIIFQDDYLYDDYSIENIMQCIDIYKPVWMATTCEHTNDGLSYYNRFTPKWNDKIWTGVNTLSSPSVITVRKDSYLNFDDNLIWMMDCDWYKRMYDIYGNPYILNTICVVNRSWGGRLSDTISLHRKTDEVRIMYNKYGNIS